MKRIVMASLLALGVLSVSQQQASAWVNTKFGVGLNLGWQSGGNCLLWGAARGSQPPAPVPGFPGYHGYVPDWDFSFGYGPAYAGSPSVAPAPAAPPATYTATPAQPGQPAAQNNAYYYGQPNYQTVTFPGNYNLPNYYYPATHYLYGR